MKSKYNPFRSAFLRLLPPAFWLIGTPISSAATYNWIGGGADSSYTTAANWSGTAPVAGDQSGDYIFSSSSPQTILDFTGSGPSNNVGTFTFDSGLPSMTITGAAFQFNTGSTGTFITNNSSSLQTINSEVRFFRDGTIDASAGDLLFGGNVQYREDLVDPSPLTLTLQGSHNGTINGGVQYINGSGATNLIKEGTGTWTLNGANTYTGTTTINAGTLKLSGSGTLGATTSPLSLNGGTLDLGGTTQSVGNINATGGGTSTLASTGGGGTLWVANSTNFDQVFNGITFNQTGGALNYAGYGQVTDATLNLSGGSSFIGLENLLGWGGSNASVNISGTHVANWYVTRMASNSVTLNLQTGGTLYTDEIHSYAPAGVVKFDGGTLGMSWLNPSRTPGDWIHGSSLTLYVENGGAIIDTNNGSATINLPFQKDGSSTGGLTKTGGNTLTLTAANTYTGNTSVEAGTLILSQASLNNNADVKLTPGATLQLNFAAADIIDELLIDGLPQASGTWGRSGHPTAAHTTSLITGDGLLQVTTGPAGGFAGWASGFLPAFTNTAADFDFENDGLDSGIEWVVGGDPTLNDAASVTPTFNNTTDPDDFLFTFRRRDTAATDPNTTIVVEYGSNLTGWTAAQNAVNGVSIDDTTNLGGGFHQVTVAIPRVLAGGSGKLFARLKIIVGP